DIFKRIVYKEFQGRHPAQLILGALGKFMLYLIFYPVDLFYKRIGIFRRKDAQVYLGNRKICSDLHLGNRDQNSRHAAIPQMILKYFCQVFLQNPTYLFLSVSFHSTKVRFLYLNLPLEKNSKFQAPNSKKGI